MKKIIFKSGIASLVLGLLSYFLQNYLSLFKYLSDVGGYGVFASIFGTLFGILMAFVVVEVWSQYNSTSSLIDDEANGLEKLFRLSIFLRDSKFTNTLKQSIYRYINTVTTDGFKTLSLGKRNNDEGLFFRKIALDLNNVKFDDEHDESIFNQMIVVYNDISEVRIKRINQSLTRLPELLKLFLYIAIGIAITVFVFLPFQLVWFAVFGTAFITFMLVMVLSIIEDLDNPFIGAWNLDTEAFKRVSDHIENDYIIK